MLDQSQILKQTRIQSEIGNKRVMQPTLANPFAKQKPEGSLTLTSLVDCFTTILVYLLLASSFGGAELQIPKNMALPHAYHSTNLEDGVVVVVGNNGEYMIEQGSKKTTVQMSGLYTSLQSDKAAAKGGQDFVVVQADKNTNFAQINPAVLTALQAGFKQVRFAVLQEDAR